LGRSFLGEAGVAQSFTPRRSPITTGGGVGGAVVMAVIGMLRNAMTKG